jgi:hypothetical protein
MHPVKTLVFLTDWMGGLPLHLHRFPGAIATPVIDEALIRDFLHGLDVVFTIETPYDYSLYKIARQMGVKTVLQYNYEYLGYLKPGFKEELPDVLLAPSKWHIKDVENEFGGRCKVDFIPFPVNTDLIRRREFKKIKTLIHVAGQKSSHTRNGTKDFIEGLRKMQYPLDVIIYTQSEEDYGFLPDWIEVRSKPIENYWDLYQEGEVLVLPRHYGGQSLQLNEAMAAGMIPAMPNIGPQNLFLHPIMLTPTSGKKKIFANIPVDSYAISPTDLGLHLDLLAQMEPEGVKALSDYAYCQALLMSWRNLKPKYDRLFAEIL